MSFWTSNRSLKLLEGARVCSGLYITCVCDNGAAPILAGVKEIACVCEVEVASFSVIPVIVLGFPKVIVKSPFVCGQSSIPLPDVRV